eukprot:3389259-Rhodomonas_salina.1
MQVALGALERNLPVLHPCVVSLPDAWMVEGRIHLCAAYRAVVSEGRRMVCISDMAGYFCAERERARVRGRARARIAAEDERG